MPEIPEHASGSSTNFSGIAKISINTLVMLSSKETNNCPYGLLPRLYIFRSTADSHPSPVAYPGDRGHVLPKMKKREKFASHCPQASPFSIGQSITLEIPSVIKNSAFYLWNIIIMLLLSLPVNSM